MIVLLPSQVLSQARKVVDMYVRYVLEIYLNRIVWAKADRKIAWKYSISIILNLFLLETRIPFCSLSRTRIPPKHTEQI